MCEDLWGGDGYTCGREIGMSLVSMQHILYIYVCVYNSLRTNLIN